MHDGGDASCAHLAAVVDARLADVDRHLREVRRTRAQLIGAARAAGPPRLLPTVPRGASARRSVPDGGLEGEEDGGEEPIVSPEVGLPGQSPSIGTDKSLIILAQFTDQASLGPTTGQWHTKYFGATDSVKDSPQPRSSGLAGSARSRTGKWSQTAGHPQHRGPRAGEVWEARGNGRASDRRHDPSPADTTAAPLPHEGWVPGIRCHHSTRPTPDS